MPTSYFPSAEEYHPGRRASSIVVALGSIAAGVLVAIAIYAAVTGKKPVKRPATSAPKPETDRARHEQAALIEEARRSASKTREVVRQNPPKEGASW